MLCDKPPVHDVSKHTLLTGMLARRRAMQIRLVSAESVSAMTLSYREGARI